MASSRAQEVAEVLWELKRAGKVATYTAIARRAGFSPGVNGRTVQTCLKTVRRDWPHLQWWRAVKDDGLLEKNSEHSKLLAECGFELVEADKAKDAVMIASFSEQLMHWDDESLPASKTAGDDVADDEEEVSELDEDAELEDDEEGEVPAEVYQDDGFDDESSYD